MKARLVLATVIGVLALMVACTIKEPQMPFWDVSIRLPLEEYTFTMEDLLEDSTIFRVDDQNPLVLMEISGDVEKQSVQSADLTIDRIDSSTTFRLDTVVIDSLSPLEVAKEATSLGQLQPDLWSQEGNTITIPEMQTPEAETQVAGGDFQSIRVYSADVFLRVKNDLPVPLLPGSIITLYNSSPDGGNGELLFQFSLPDRIFPGDTWVDSASIFDVNLMNPLVVRFTLHMDSSETPVLITTDLLRNSYLSMDLVLKNIKAEEAIARLTAHEYRWNEKVALEEEDKIYYGELKQGLLHLQVNNTLPVGGLVRVKFLNIRQDNNAPYTYQMVIGANESNSYDIDISGLKIVPLLPDGQVDLSRSHFIDSIWYQIYVTNDPTAGAVAINARDSIFVHLVSEEFVFGELDGEITSRTITIDPVTENNILDYQQYEGKIDFRDLKLVFTLYNELNVENVTFTLHLSAIHKENGVITNGKTISPLLTGQLMPGTPEAPSENRFEIAGRDIAELVNMLPTDITVWGEAQVAGRVNIREGDGIFGKYQFIAPMEIRIPQPVVLQSDLNVLDNNDISEDLQKEIREERVNQLDLLTKITNHLPVGGTFYLVFDRQESRLDTLQAELIIRLDAFQAAPVNQDGLVVNPVSREQQIELTNDQIQLFASPPVYWKYLLMIDPTDSTKNQGFVKILKDYSSSIEGLLEFQLRVED